MLPSPDILNELPYGKFVLSNLAAKRAKQLGEGAMPLVNIDSPHPLTIALAEIAAGKIKPVLMEYKPDILVESDLPTILTDENVPAELGMLLPALDETETALVASIDEEHDEEHDEHEPVTLSDLIGEEDIITPAAGEEDTLSLSDIAEQESADDDEEHAAE